MSGTHFDRRTFLVASAAAATVLVAKKRSAAAPNLMSKEAVLFDPDLPVLGNARGDVTIVEFFDYQCPYCKKAHPDVVKLVATDGRIRHLMKDWPIFGPPSVYASRLVLGAGHDMRKARDALLATQGRLTADDVNETLQKAGLSPRMLNAGYLNEKQRINGLLERNGAQAEGFGFIGTPSYVIGTTIYPGVLTADDMNAAVARARSG